VRKASEWMVGHGFDFLITGDSGRCRRPMSRASDKDRLPVVQDESGIGDLLLRPLSARTLAADPSRARRLGDRSRLLDLPAPQPQAPDGAGRPLWAPRLRRSSPPVAAASSRRAVRPLKLADLWRSRGERRYELDDIILLKGRPPHSTGAPLQGNRRPRGGRGEFPPRLPQAARRAGAASATPGRTP